MNNSLMMLNNSANDLFKSFFGVSFNDAFNNLGGMLNKLSDFDFVPASKFVESENGYKMEMENFDTGNVKVDYDDDTRLITVSVEKVDGSTKSHSSFTTSIPENADDNTIAATVNKGVLTISIDKLPVVEEVKEDGPRTITVNRK